MLHTADPTMHPDIAGRIDEALHLPSGHDIYRHGRPVLSPEFRETSAGTLAFGLSVGDPQCSPADRTRAATEAIRQLARNSFGRDALSWVDAQTEALRGAWTATPGNDAWVAAAYDRNGIREAQVTYAFGPGIMDSLPAPVFEVVRSCLVALPALEPAFSTIRAGRSAGSQQVTFRVRGPIALSALQPLMERIGLGARHAGLTSAVAFVLGARFTLPADTMLITLRPTPAGIELRLDIDLDGIPDVPPNVGSLLGMQLAERPRSLRALERWVAAFTADGYDNPGRLSVLSVVARPDMPARLALHLRPSVIAESDEPALAGQPSNGWSS